MPMNLQTTYLRVREDASVEPLPVDDTFWPRLIGGELGTFRGEQLVTIIEHGEDWPNWEMHPKGDEIVVLLDGRVTFVLERESGLEEIELGRAGDFVVVPRGVWHTARVHRPSRALFITPGEGTVSRSGESSR